MEPRTAWAVAPTQETDMKLKKLALATAVGIASAISAPAFAGPPDERELHEMLKRSAMIRADGMVTKSDFIKLMEKRFDSADKGRRGMLTPQEIARILDPNIANP
jgi:hypothetical protein